MIATNHGAQAAGPAVAPVPASERFAALDVLRGVALFGILVINIQLFAGSPTVAFNMPLRVAAQAGANPVADTAAMTLQWLFFEGKMRALFSMLYGAGSMLMFDRLERRHGAGHAADIFHRRNMWLLLIGVVHGALIWSGDVLFFYASVSLLALYPIRHLSGRRLIQIGLPLALLGGTFGIWNLLDIGGTRARANLEERALDAMAKGITPDAAAAEALAKARIARAQQLQSLSAPSPVVTSYFSSLPGNAAGYRGFVTAIFTSGWVLETLGLLIAGMGLLKSGFLTGRLSSRSYVRIAVAGYAVSIAIVLAGLLHSAHYGFSSSVTTVWMMLPYEVQTIAAALAHAAVIVLIVKHDRFRSVQRAVAAVGQMALTNYLLTSIVCQWLFVWSGLLPHAGLDHYQLLPVVLGVWTLNIAISVIWLRFFAFGPLEWVWRSLTYWKAQPMVIGPRAGTACCPHGAPKG
jgi:uncharacterized protein